MIASKLARHVFGERFDVWQFMSIGRVSTVLFSLALGILVLTWARSLYGKWIGLVTFGLYVFEPNIIAHSRLITTDIFAAGTITLTLFLFWRFLEETSFRRGLLAALGLGLCQIAKYTGLFLYPLLILLTIIRSWG
ncbi:MAG: glycosyltransferase family 39 protein [Anaerolineales bacterium]|nr:glycosyltransferase family 39 protein [Anaerolineales bacterium]